MKVDELRHSDYLFGSHAPNEAGVTKAKAKASSFLEVNRSDQGNKAGEVRNYGYLLHFTESKESSEIHSGRYRMMTQSAEVLGYIVPFLSPGSFCSSTYTIPYSVQNLDSLHPQAAFKHHSTPKTNFEGSLGMTSLV